MTIVYVAYKYMTPIALNRRPRPNASESLRRESQQVPANFSFGSHNLHDAVGIAC